MTDTNQDVAAESEGPPATPQPDRRHDAGESDTAVDRRSVLRATGVAGGAGVGAAGVASVSGQETVGGDQSTDQQKGMAIDLNACIACLKCVKACKEENNTSAGANWMHVFRYEDPDAGDGRWADDPWDGSMPRPCQHCSSPSCANVCPTQARYKRDHDGIVLTDYDLCIGCRYCEVGCPYGVNYFQWGEPTDEADGFNHPVDDRDGRPVAGNPPTGMMGKCTFCVHRQDEPAFADVTACEERCPVDAIHFGDMNDPDSDPQQYLDDNDRANRFRLLGESGNDPNVVYLGHEPSAKAEPVEGPYSYEDLGMVETRQDVINNGGDGQ